MLEGLTTHAPWLLPVIALGGIAGVGWRYVKLIWGYATALVIVNVELEGILSIEAMIYCWENFKALTMNPKKFSGFHLYVKRLKRSQLVALEDFGGSGLLFWKGWRPILMTTRSSKKDGEGDAPVGEHEEGIRLTYFRGTFDLSDLLQSICNEHNDYSYQSMQERKKREINRFYVATKSGCRGRLAGEDGKGEITSECRADQTGGVNRRSKTKRPLGYSWDQLGEQPDKDDPSPFEFFAYPAFVMRLVADLEHWLSSQKWYADRRIPWRWGVLATGPPGAGKSMLIRSIGEYLGLPVYFFDLASMTNEDFIGAWAGVVHSSPCIAAFEDMDTVFNGRKNLTAEKGGHTLPLTFDCVLNRISGVAKSDGVLLFITSNNAETLDPALCDASLGSPSRPGRIDTSIVLDGMDEDCRRRVAKVVLKDDLKHVEALVELGENDQPAQFHYRCARHAQSLYWARKTGEAHEKEAS